MSAAKVRTRRFGVLFCALGLLTALAEVWTWALVGIGVDVAKAWGATAGAFGAVGVVLLMAALP